MPASTVTVIAAASIAITLFIGFKEIKLSLLSAIVLKQWRVPSTFILLYFFTMSATCSIDSAGYKRSVLYSILPAQFFIFSPGISLSNGENKGAVMSAEDNLIKVLFFIVLYYDKLYN